MKKLKTYQLAMKFYKSILETLVSERTIEIINSAEQF